MPIFGALKSKLLDVQQKCLTPQKIDIDVNFLAQLKIRSAERPFQLEVVQLEALTAILNARIFNIELAL